MARQSPKCCCCVPLRPGLLAWAYIKLVLALAAIGLYTYLNMFSLRHLEEHLHYYHNPAMHVLESLWPFAACLLYLVFTFLFIVGVHRESYKLLVVFLVSSLFEVILGGVAIGYNLVDLISVYYRLFRPEYHDGLLQLFIYNPGFYQQVIGPIVVNILLPIYFMVLTKSELKRLKISRGGPRVVLNKHVSIYDGTSQKILGTA